MTTPTCTTSAAKELERIYADLDHTRDTVRSNAQKMEGTILESALNAFADKLDAIRFGTTQW